MKGISKMIQAFLDSQNISSLRPAQEKAIAAGVLEGNNVVICTPTASGKTLIAEIAYIERLKKGDKGLYIAPLKALASEKYREFSRRHAFDCALSIGDHDGVDKKLAEKDLIITTAEKLDSLLRHDTPWLSRVKVVVVDEVHLLNDSHRGPTLEILLTLLRRKIKPQIIALSATIGNPQELADWLDAALVTDDWRPVRLDKGIFQDGKIIFPQAPEE